MKNLTLSFCASDNEYFTALRLVAGTVCSVADLDIDAAEDFKVCVTEAALIIKNNGFKNITATFSQTGNVRCVIEGSEGEATEADNDLSIALIGALVGECSVKTTDGVTSAITLEM